MLQLVNIHKSYPAGDGSVRALRGVSLRFRRNEFVSILGPSGCGKTTMLNIIGGLDQYTEGDLIINGRSTKGFRDRDWDTYRNHSIGFVFQSYHLIPHQSVLQNVELALTLSGVSRQERRRRAIEALEAVGLHDQLRKKPSEMSGGQMQRVAIARALVNNPDIILADEPTGALDTETSVQVMDILREVARDRLVIMVTHNPELAEKYSTRIIRMLDGEVLSDSRPVTEEEVQQGTNAQEEPKSVGKRDRKPSMSLATAFSLSLKNLISKRGRTLLTSFAGSIGIIGIALIFAVSQGLTTYIDTLQEDTLSSYPLTLQETHMDMGSLMGAFIGQAMSAKEHENDAVYPKNMVYNMVNALGSMEDTKNDLAAFKRYIEQEKADPESDLYSALSGVQYTYSVPLEVYTQSVDGTIIHSDAEALMQEMMMDYFRMDMSAMVDMSASMGVTTASMSPMSSAARIWQEMLPGENGDPVSPVLKKQYDVVYGTWPTQHDEIVLVLDADNEIADMTLYALGLKSKAEIDALAEAAFTQGAVEVKDERWTYEEICGMDFRVVLGYSCYVYDEAAGAYTDLRETQAGLRYLYDNGVRLRVSGIIKPNEEAVSSMLTGTIAYTSDLTRFIIREAEKSPLVQAQLADKTTDVFTGLPFQETTGSMTDEEKAAELLAYIGNLDEKGKAEAYVKMMSVPTQEQVDALLNMSLRGMTREKIEAMMQQGLTQQMSISAEDMSKYISAMSDEELMRLVRQMAEQSLRQQYAQQQQQRLSALSENELSAKLQELLPTLTEAQLAASYDDVVVFSESNYDYNMVKLGYVDLDKPASISLYAASFEDKDAIEAAIAAYNDSVSDLERISYTDYVGLMMSSVTTIIDAITYVLITFVSISLVVSSIMIGVITLISVQERTKEIGILRAIGASKKNVSSMFSAETLIIGFTSGALGVIVTWLLCIPINAIIQELTGLLSLEAYLPWQVALILVGISMLLTLFAGIIPSRSAAKKDPVVALRTE